MFGPGFVWLVAKDSDRANLPGNPAGKLAILCTYLAGSPYPAAHYRAQPHDMAAGYIGRNAGDPRKRVNVGGQDLTPLMCVSTWEHVYMRDFGPGAKAQYLEAWWKCIDWRTVEGNLVERPARERARTYPGFNLYPGR